MLTCAPSVTEYTKRWNKCFISRAVLKMFFVHTAPDLYITVHLHNMAPTALFMSNLKSVLISMLTVRKIYCCLWLELH